MVCEPLQPARAAKPSGFFHKALKWGNVASDNLFARGTEEGRGVFYELEKIHKVCLQGCTRQDTEFCPGGEGENVVPAFSPGCQGERGHLLQSLTRAPKLFPIPIRT